jgi:serine/threonine protein kinase
MERPRKWLAGADWYTAPEFASHSDARLDVYSFGIIMCEVLVSFIPVEGIALVRNPSTEFRWGRDVLLNCAATKLSRLPPPLATLLCSCCAVDVEDRPSASQALDRFLELFQDRAACQCFFVGTSFFFFMITAMQMHTD